MSIIVFGEWAPYLSVPTLLKPIFNKVEHLSSGDITADASSTMRQLIFNHIKSIRHFKSKENKLTLIERQKKY